ncbi:MAG: hypothetical protein OEY67_02895, partial [Gammaproteobacteria bacterium]|nr:hypothetical protein [Gammaproteobacteria bacterium]
PNGNIVRKPYYQILFSDGTDYSFRSNLHDLTKAQQNEIIEFISQSSHREISVIDPFPESAGQGNPPQ